MCIDVDPQIDSLNASILEQEKSLKLPELRLRKGYSNIDPSKPIKLGPNLIKNEVSENSEKSFLRNLEDIDPEELELGGLDLDIIAEMHENELDEELNEAQDEEDDITILMERHNLLQQELDEGKKPRNVGKNIRYNMYMVGDNREGKCGNEIMNTFAKKPVLIRRRFETINCGYHHNAAVDEDGLVYTWGRATFGQLGQGEIINNRIPTLLAKPLMFVQIQEVSCGWQHTIALTYNGFMFSWGLNINGQLGLGDYHDRDAP